MNGQDSNGQEIIEEEWDRKGKDKEWNRDDDESKIMPEIEMTCEMINNKGNSMRKTTTPKDKT